jgi:hypothetical protein
MARQPDIAMIKEHDRSRGRALTMSETENRQSKDDASGGDTSGADAVALMAVRAASIVLVANCCGVS